MAQEPLADELPVLISADDIQRRVSELGAQIAAEHADSPGLIVIGVLKGAFLFMADLVRAIDRPMTCDFIRVSSYAGTQSTGEVRFEFDTTQPVTGKDVILVEDIIDTGLTIRFLLDTFANRNPRSLKVASLLHKKARTQQPVAIDYLGFEIDDVFIVGYGLDYEGRHRNLPYLSRLDAEHQARGV